MMNPIILSLIAISVFSASTNVHAEGVNGSGTSGCETQLTCLQGSTGGGTAGATTGSTTGAINSGTATGGGLGTTSGLGSLGSGAYAQAMAAQKKAQMTMMLGIALGAAFASQCGKFNPTACMLAAAAFGAAAMAGGKANQAGNLMDQLGTNAGGAVGGATAGSTNGSVPGDEIDGQLAAIKEDLSKKGYQINKDGSVTAPNGAVVDPGMSEQSLAAAGMNNSDINGLKSGLDKMRGDLAGAGNGDGSGGDNSGDMGMASNAMSGAYGADTSETGNGKGSGGAGNERTGLNERDPASWDGFYKQLGDSTIGVAGNDIFRMVEKRVETERIVMGH